MLHDAVRGSAHTLRAAPGRLGWTLLLCVLRPFSDATLESYGNQRCVVSFSDLRTIITPILAKISSHHTRTNIVEKLRIIKRRIFYIPYLLRAYEAM